MNARQWMQAVALASAIGLAAPVLANDTRAAGARFDASPPTSFDTQPSLDSTVTTRPEPSAADRSSNGAINGAVEGSVGATHGGTTALPQPPDDSTAGRDRAIDTSARKSNSR